MTRPASLTVLVDGGASGCRLQVRDASGCVCGEAQSGPASLSLDSGLDNNVHKARNSAWQNILAGISQLAEQTGNAHNWRPQHLVMGLAGALHKERRSQLLALAQSHAEAVTLVSDGHAQLLGASGGEPGACLAVGTGSVLHWINKDGKPGMAGGWGFPAGDEASGAWLGLQAINRFTRWYDHPVADPDPFYPRMRLLLGAELTDIQTWTTCKSPTQLATLAPELVILQAGGSKIARDILQQGTVALEKLLELAPAELPVFLAGGLATIYRSQLGKPWQTRLQTPHGDIFAGLWHLGQRSDDHVG